VRPAGAGEAGDSRTGRGLVVEEVSGPAAVAGIQPGDVVLAANGRPVRQVQDLRTAVADSKDIVALLVQRGSSRIFVPVELS
jgi:serine protease Do